MISISGTRASSTVCVAFGILLVLCLGGAYASSLPVPMGWENGPLENAQVALLLAAGTAALFYGAKPPLSQPGQRVIWKAMAPLWFLMAAREISWGAALCVPVHFDSLTGPTFSSTQQLWYRPAVVPLACALLLWCAWQLRRAGLAEVVLKLWNERALPVAEIALFAACMAVSAMAEGHLRLLNGTGLTSWQYGAAAQSFEELAELCAYTALVFAQWRVARSWRGASTRVSAGAPIRPV